MYLPKHFSIEDRKTLIDFMRVNSMATLVSIKENTPIANHLPFVIEERDGKIILSTHVSIANEQWKVLNENSLVIFSGPHAYVSPSYYDVKESVPTWNYTAVHAYGVPKILDSLESKKLTVEKLIHSTEENYFEQWENLPKEFKERMLKGIVVFEIEVTRMEGKFKLSQNKTLNERKRITETFKSNKNSVIHDTGIMMERFVL